MKTLIVTLTILLSTSLVVAGNRKASNNNYHDTEMKSVLGNQSSRVGIWGGLSTQFTSIGDNDAVMFGAKGGIIMNSSLTVGIAGFGLSGYLNDLWYPNLDNGKGAYLDGGYGGLFIEPVIAPNLPVHISLPIIIGAGGVGYTKSEVYDWNDPYYYHDSYVDLSPFFVIEPGIELEMNLMRFVKFGAGVSYRYTKGLNLMETSKTILNGYSAGFTLKLGVF